jgi:hypothetical protein
MAIIWGLGLLTYLRPPIDSASGLLTALGQWWGAAVIPSLWWPGLLVVGFGAASWSRRRWPEAAEWKPRAADRMPGGRLVTILSLVGIVGGLFLLSDPRWILDVFYGGRAAPAAYEALTYTDTFRQGPAPYLFLVIMLNIPMFVTIMVDDRWSRAMRRSRDWLGLVTCAVMAWTVLNGPVFVAPSADRMIKSVMVLIVAITLIGMALKLYRRVRPAPSPQAQA